MKKYIIFIMLTILAAVSFSRQGQADWMRHDRRTGADFRPYLENGTSPQHAAERLNKWAVSDWAATPALGRARLGRFFATDILRSYEQDHATLRLGPGFYHLSAYDKKRVVTLFRSLRMGQGAGILHLQDAETCAPIGVVTRAGLVDFQ